MFRKIDDWILTRAQAAYLWLLDETGVYVATCSVVVYMLGKAAWYTTRTTPIWWVDTVFLVVMMVLFSASWATQHAGREETYNAQAREWRDGAARRVFMIVWIAFVVGDVAGATSTARLACDLVNDITSWIALLVIPTVQIRKREPPEKTVLAPARGGV
jgi:hypothetical protein